jgi:hypothetical protein
MSLFSIKSQEVRAGGFTLRFGSHDDDSNTCYLQVNGATEGQQLVFQRDGDVLRVQPLATGPALGVLPGEPLKDLRTSEALGNTAPFDQFRQPMDQDLLNAPKDATGGVA